MTRADVLAYAQTLEFIPPCLHWGTCQACGVTVWWAEWHGITLPSEFRWHPHSDDMVGNVIHGGYYRFSNVEREGRIDPDPPQWHYAPKPRST